MSLRSRRFCAEGPGRSSTFPLSQVARYRAGHPSVFLGGSTVAAGGLWSGEIVLHLFCGAPTRGQTLGTQGRGEVTSVLRELVLECDGQAGLLAVPKHQTKVQAVLRTAGPVPRGGVGESIFCHQLPRGSWLRP